MPIFGSRDIFGRSRFGQANFGELSLYELVPKIHRSLDENEGFPVKKLFTAFQEELEDLRRQIDVIPFQRDPYLATGLDYPPILTVNNVQNIGNGEAVLTFDLEHGLSSVDQIDLLGSLGSVFDGRKQVVRIVDDNSVVVTENMHNSVLGAKVLRVVENACLVEVLDIVPYEESWGDFRKPMVKMTVSSHSNVDVGLGFTCKIKANQPIPPPENAFLEPDQALYKVLYARRRDRVLGGNFEIICDGGVVLEDLSGELPDRVITVFTRPSSLSLLANDYGLVSDDNLPDIYQRAEVANVYQYLRLKSSKKAYEARSAGGGFRVTVTQLYRVCEEDLDSIPEQNIFIGTTGGGNTGYYTDLVITRPRYDDLSADVVLPSGASITDASLFSRPTSTAFSQELHDYFKCLFKLRVDSITYQDDPDVYFALGFTTPIYEVKLFNPNWPNVGWEVATVLNGSFSLTDSNDNTYVVDGTDADNRMLLEQFKVYTQAVQLFFDVGDEVCVSYTPEADELDCCICPSAEIMITIEALPAFINQSGYSGQALAEAVKRILERLKREQIPIHVHTAIEQLVINIDVEVPNPTVELDVGIEIESIDVDFEGGRRFDCRYDDIPADEEELDTCAMLLSYPSVTLAITEGPPPQSGVIVNIDVEPLDIPTIDLIIEGGVRRDILVTGSSFYDDIPADDLNADDPSATIEPQVTVEVIIGG